MANHEGIRETIIIYNTLEIKVVLQSNNQPVSMITYILTIIIIITVYAFW